MKKLTSILLAALFTLCFAQPALAANETQTAHADTLNENSGQLPVPGGIWAAAAGATSIKVGWEPVDGARYTLYQSANGKDYTSVASLISGETGYTVGNVTPNKTYYFKLRVQNSFGAADSSVVQAKAVFQGVAGVTASSNGVKSIKLGWSKVNGAAGYTIYRALGDGSFKKLASTTKLSYTDKSVAKGKKYRYKVRAYVKVTSNGSTQNVYAPYSKVSGAAAAPKAPTSVTAKQGGYNSVKVTWKKSSGAKGYFIYRATSANGKYKKIATVKGAGKNSYTDKSVKTGTKYYYKVSAYTTVSKKNVAGSYSAVKNATPSLKKAASVTASKISGGKSTVEWKKVAGASGYEIYKSTTKNGSYTKAGAAGGGSKVKKTIGGLERRYSYYFKVRPYRTVSGKKVYGSFSAAAYAEGENVLRGTNMRKVSLEIFDLVNKERKKAGVPELKWDNQLFSAAELRAAECSVYFSHTRPNNTLCFTASSKAWGENIAAGQNTAKAVMDSWMNSPGHRSNILNPRFTTIGIGTYKPGSTAGYDVYGIYYTQMFGTDGTNDGRKGSAKNTTAKFTIEIGSGIPGWS